MLLPRAGAMLLRRVASVLRDLSVPLDGRAAVAFSGGCDSAALLGMAREIFAKGVTAVTVDHRLRPESSQEAGEAARLAQQLGVPHHVVPLQWVELPTYGVQQRARKARYQALVDFCAERSMGTLLLGHHLDDQIETFLHRLSNESGVKGLACMESMFCLLSAPGVRQVRPMLGITKTELQQYCEENAIVWVQDPTNESNVYFRNRVRKVLRENQWLGPPIVHLIGSMRRVEEEIGQRVLSACNELVAIEKRHGFATVGLHRYRELPPPVGKRLLLSLLHHIGGHTNALSTAALNGCYDYILARTTEPNKAANLAHCNVVLLDSSQFMVARQRPPLVQLTLTSIALGEPLVWDNRFTVTLSQTARGTHAHSTPPGYWVRHMLEDDYRVVVKGLRRRKATKLPPVHARGGLPVVVDAKGCIVAAPHLGYLDVKFGVTCSVTFDPAVPLHSCVPFYARV